MHPCFRHTAMHALMHQHIRPRMCMACTAFAPTGTHWCMACMAPTPAHTASLFCCGSCVPRTGGVECTHMYLCCVREPTSSSAQRRASCVMTRVEDGRTHFTQNFTWCAVCSAPTQVPPYACVIYAVRHTPAAPQGSMKLVNTSQHSSGAPNTAPNHSRDAPKIL